MKRSRTQCAGEGVIQVLGFGLALVVFSLAGCDAPGDGYDPNLTYPLRPDPLVVETPKAAPTRPADPGKLDQSILALPALGGRIATPNTLDEAKRESVRQSLDAIFGTPASPKLDLANRPALLGDVELGPESLAEGSRHYRRLCSQCHGLTGDGRGVTGPWIYPHPRDFRQGVFKIAAGSPKPSVAAMTKLLRRGITGSSMPLFDLISDAEVRSILAYTIHLSVRGEAEFRVLRDCLDESGDREVSNVAGECRTQSEKILAEWVRAQEAGAPPASDSANPDAIRRGHELFTKTAGCASCHQDFGRTETYRYDVWGGAVRVTDVTQGKFRWGGEPAELAARIRHGIPASGMPANPTITDDQVRDLVGFVRAAGYPQQLPPDVRDQVYPPAR